MYQRLKKKSYDGRTYLHCYIRSLKAHFFLLTPPVSPSFTPFLLLPLHTCHFSIMATEHKILEEESWSGRALDRSKWTRKEFITLMVCVIFASYLFSVDYNLNYMVKNIPLNLFNSSSLAAIAPTLSNILTIVLVPFYAKFSDVIGRAEVITIALLLQVIGYIVETTSNNFEQLTIGGFVASVGSTGYSCLQSVIIAGKWVVVTTDRSVSFILLARLYDLSIS